MVSTRIIFFFLFNMMFLMITQSSAQTCLNDKGNYTANSTYQKNLNTLLTALPSSNNSNGYGFYYSSLGRSPNQVHVIGHCRGDITPDDCRSCLNESRVSLTQRCPNQKEAIVWGKCMLRYSNRSIYGVMEIEPGYFVYNTQDLSPGIVEEFNNKLEELLESLRVQAASSGPLRKFAFGSRNTSGPFLKVYGMATCTPDTSEKNCSDCLDGAFRGFTMYGKIGGRLYRPSCNFGFEIENWINASNVLPLPSSSSPPISPPEPSSPTNTTIPGGPESNKSRIRTIVIIVVPISVSLLLITFIYVCFRVRKTNEILAVLPGEDADEISTMESLQFDLDTIKVATNNFSEANKLGQGGFGPVYKGRLINGEDIAVKRLSINSGQGDLEFKNEVLLMAKLQHRNLVRLLGFCLERNEKLLVYEFVPNTSLDHIVFDPIKRAQLDWNTRHKIIEGISRGLLYLHEDSRLRIIHRDLKASNILIDADMNAKISDFGMAKLFVVDQTQGNTSRIVGTYGYMAPEYVTHGHFSVKSDVFSFGVLILEIISGQKNSCFRHEENAEYLLTYAWKSWREGTALNLVDPTLKTGSRNEILRCIHIGLLCVQKNVAVRPTMASIILMLNSYSLSLPVPSQPAFFMHSGVESDMSLGWENNSRQTIESDQSTSNSVKMTSDNEEDSQITQVYAR